MDVKSNALAGETSPYLLQHSDNPVAWHPWGPRALALARQDDKPILLSIGYSACHWCHVMAHESFEDAETAALMNKLFVNIKVDREERPDLDKIYQTAHQLLTRRPGGWPLTMFLMPDDHAPFFGGTYFPREQRHGLPGFKDVLSRIAAAYREQTDEIREQNRAVVGALDGLQVLPAGDADVISGAPLAETRRYAGETFDRQHGGFGGAPKFPHPPSIERLLRDHAASPSAARDTEAQEMALFTLGKMARGGMYDQLGGGFARYSVDDQWQIPHFEKMLYDNGPLLTLYSEAWQLTGDALFEKAARETAEWCLRDMQSPEGGFYSSLDADSEGHEGKFYVWIREEVKDLLDDQQYGIFARHYGLDRSPNFEGKWNLHVFVTLAEVAEERQLSEPDARELLDNARQRLLEVRNKRIWPGRDDKVLTSWNALMIKGLAVAGRVFNDDSYLQAAERAVDFIRDTLWTDGRLLATYKDGKAHLNAYLDDYAFLLDALLRLLEARWRLADLEFASELAETMLAKFEDNEQGGFFFTSHDHEQLILRSKPFSDDALPAGNGVAAHALLRLGHILGDTRFLASAERCLIAGWTSVERMPAGHNAMLLALEEYLHPTQTIVLRGVDKDLARWRHRCVEHYAPRRLTFAIPNDQLVLPGLLNERSAGVTPVAYLCEGHHCEAPITGFEALDSKLSGSEIVIRDS